MLKITRLVAVATVSACAALLSPATARADTACKGLEQARCTANAGCRWIKAIVMKNGKPRKAHCRKIATKKAA
jgi:hypothetical protein